MFRALIICLCSIVGTLGENLFLEFTLDALNVSHFVPGNSTCSVDSDDHTPVVTFNGSITKFNLAPEPPLPLGDSEYVACSADSAVANITFSPPLASAYVTVRIVASASGSPATADDVASDWSDIIDSQLAASNASVVYYVLSSKYVNTTFSKVPSVPPPPPPPPVPVPASAPAPVSDPSGFLAGHNERRALEKACPALTPMEWHAALEATATEWAKQLCATDTFQHSSSAFRTNVGGFSGLGENLYMKAGGASPTAAAALSAWYAEKSAWSFGRGGIGAGGCQDGSVCGHYTQMVWSSSLALGCSTCQVGSVAKYITVCHYGAAGNFIGTDPYTQCPTRARDALLTQAVTQNPVTLDFQLVTTDASGLVTAISDSAASPIRSAGQTLTPVGMTITAPGVSPFSLVSGGVPVVVVGVNVPVAVPVGVALTVTPVPTVTVNTATPVYVGVPDDDGLLSASAVLALIIVAAALCFLAFLLCIVAILFVCCRRGNNAVTPSDKAGNDNEAGSDEDYYHIRQLYDFVVSDGVVPGPHVSDLFVMALGVDVGRPAGRPPHAIEEIKVAPSGPALQSFPVGSVAILVCEIFEAQYLWGVQRAAMRDAVNVFMHLVHEVASGTDGFVARHNGHAFMLVYKQHLKALEAALSIQSLMLEAPWPSAVLGYPDVSNESPGFKGLRVRSAIDMGTATEGSTEVQYLKNIGKDASHATRAALNAVGGEIILCEKYCSQKIVPILEQAGIDVGPVGTVITHLPSTPTSIGHVPVSAQFPSFSIEYVGAVQLPESTRPEALFRVFPANLTEHRKASLPINLLDTIHKVSGTGSSATLTPAANSAGQLQESASAPAVADVWGDATVASKSLLNDIPAPSSDPIVLVFTDIENSTELWNLGTRGMLEVLSAHNAVLRELLIECRGYEVKTEGDAFMVAFDNVNSAVKWAVRVQLGLLERTWPAWLSTHRSGKVEEGLWNGPRVRIGIHMNDMAVEMFCERDPITQRMDYFGVAVNYAARVSSQGHGGEIVCSSSITSAIRGYGLHRIIDGMTIEVDSIGTRCLKGFDNDPEIFRIYPPQLFRRNALFDEAAEKEAHLRRVSTAAAVSFMPSEVDAKWDLSLNKRRRSFVEKKLRENEKQGDSKKSSVGILQKLLNLSNPFSSSSKESGSHSHRSGVSRGDQTDGFSGVYVPPTVAHVPPPPPAPARPDSHSVNYASEINSVKYSSVVDAITPPPPRARPSPATVPDPVQTAHERDRAVAAVIEAKSLAAEATQYAEEAEQRARRDRLLAAELQHDLDSVDKDSLPYSHYAPTGGEPPALPSYVPLPARETPTSTSARRPPRYQDVELPKPSEAQTNFASTYRYGVDRVPPSEMQTPASAALSMQSQAYSSLRQSAILSPSAISPAFLPGVSSPAFPRKLESPSQSPSQGQQVTQIVFPSGPLKNPHSDSLRQLSPADIAGMTPSSVYRHYCDEFGVNPIPSFMALLPQSPGSLKQLSSVHLPVDFATAGSLHLLAALETLVHADVVSLSVVSCGLGTSGIEWLCCAALQMPNLTALDVGGTSLSPISVGYLKYLARHHQSLRYIGMGATNVSAEIVSEVLSQMQGRVN